MNSKSLIVFLTVGISITSLASYRLGYLHCQWERDAKMSKESFDELEDKLYTRTLSRIQEYQERVDEFDQSIHNRMDGVEHSTRKLAEVQGYRSIGGSWIKVGDPK